MKSFVFNRALVFGALFAVLSTGVQAAATLTLSDCLKEAALHNPELIQARLALKQSEYGKKSARGRFLPNLSAGASAGRSGNEGSLSGILGADNPDRSYSLSLSLSENLFNGFKDKAAYDSASASKMQAEASLRQSRAQVGRDVRTAFTNLLYAQRQVEQLADIVRRQKNNVAMVELHYQGGVENKGSLLNSQASATQAEYELLQGRRSLRMAQRQINRVMGRNLMDDPKVEGAFEVILPGESPDFRELAVTVPSVLIAEAQLKAAKSQVTGARGEFLPSLSATGGMSRSGNDWAPRNPSWHAGLSLSMPIFSGGQDYYGLQSARARRDQSASDLEAVRLDAALSIENAYWAFLNAFQLTQVQRKYLEASKVQQEVAQAQYTNGLLSYQNWDQIESSFISRQKNDLQSQRDAKNAEAQWDLARGVCPIELENQP